MVQKSDVCNENIEDFVVYDWALELKSADKIEEFLQDPIKFLQEIGSLEKFPDFNGFVDSDGKKIEPSDLRAHYEKNGGGKKFSLFHRGIPYREPYYCTILV